MSRTWKIQAFNPHLCDGCTSMKMCERFGIDIKECGMWLSCADITDSLEDAIELAKSYCSWLDDGNNVRIVCPDGKII